MKNLKNFKTEKMCFEEVKKDGMNLKYVPNEFKTETVCFAAIVKNIFALEYLPNKFLNSSFLDLALDVHKDDPQIKKAAEQMIFYMKALEECENKLRQGF